MFKWRISCDLFSKTNPRILVMIRDKCVCVLDFFLSIFFVRQNFENLVVFGPFCAYTSSKALTPPPTTHTGCETGKKLSVQNSPRKIISVVLHARDIPYKYVRLCAMCCIVTLRLYWCTLYGIVDCRQTHPKNWWRYSS